MIDAQIDETFDNSKRHYSQLSNSTDDWSVYGQHVGNKLRSYQPKTAVIVQHMINSLLFSADMGTYDIPSIHQMYMHNQTSSTFSSCTPPADHQVEK